KRFLVGRFVSESRSQAHFSIGTSGSPEASYGCALAQSLFKKPEPAFNYLGVGRGAGVGRGLGVGPHLPVYGVGVGVGVGVGPPSAQYRPPLTKNPGSPPQTIISRSVQTAVCLDRAPGALMVLLLVQVPPSGLYFPPVAK